MSHYLAEAEYTQSSTWHTSCYISSNFYRLQVRVTDFDLIGVEALCDGLAELAELAECVGWGVMRRGL